MKLALLPAPGGLAAAVEEAVWCFSEREPIMVAGPIEPGKRLLEVVLPGGEIRFPVRVSQAGDYALFTEHHPDEFSAELRGQTGALKAKQSHAYKPDHEHDDEVSSVGITIPGDLDNKKLNKWLGELLRTKGQDVFRMKGVLAIKGDATATSSRAFTCSSTASRIARGARRRAPTSSSSSAVTSTARG